MNNVVMQLRSLLEFVSRPYELGYRLSQRPDLGHKVTQDSLHLLHKIMANSSTGYTVGRIPNPIDILGQ